MGTGFTLFFYINQNLNQSVYQIEYPIIQYSVYYIQEK